ncbi:uncharacterized protein PGTG_12954 [Puccinia graminis f. sp. tritici CRL 75-36-700-3]|uniref:DUS-like FMN-binding domain-containing protein n=1 Tax=Puccinia graminis f. sp. tritici (strain CRL 75-36-700-3 / race SCCL) TaxID=418459 RepID=E3KQJ7_PUCGT|nr:uncharacterized protein PGTG_12954 [Puccinia graminis f. sp. tritici CRL 75-36-700-3]EFP86572.2 hypothetical protein PGTG_12954 [Puccinia graminis f. sp. tritici CRL 75-36-700-3]
MATTDTDETQDGLSRLSLEDAEILSPQQMLNEFEVVHICAPMVRYSKLPFRQLVSEYETHITFTPMILHRVAKRKGISRYVDGIDINCGCPQQWACKEGIGSALLRKPDLVRELVRFIKVSCGQDFPVSIKIRIDDDLRNTSQLIKTAIQANVSMITVHGEYPRLPKQRKAGKEMRLKGVNDGRTVPVVAKGDIFSLDDARKIREMCEVHGVMSARGLQENTALFAGYDRIPLAGIQRFLSLSAQNGFMFPLFHRHLADMLGPWFSSQEEKKFFNMLSSPPFVIDFLEETYNIQPPPLPEIIF